MAEVLPCPHCGGEPEVDEFGGVSCPHCRNYDHVYCQINMELWNTRIPIKDTKEEKEYEQIERGNKKMDLANLLTEQDKDKLIKSLQDENAQLRARLGKIIEGMLNIIRRDSEIPR